LTASFHSPEPSKLDRGLDMPKVPDPDTLISEGERYKTHANDGTLPEQIREYFKQRLKRINPIDLRWVSPPTDPASQFLQVLLKPDSKEKSKEMKQQSENGQQMFWMRSKQRLVDDPNIHRAVLAYASDFNLLTTARGATKWTEITMMASLDHSMWFHAPFRADEWLLYVMESPRASMSRGLAIGYIFRRDGVLAVTVAQEGLIRCKVQSSSQATQRSPTSKL